MNIEPGNPRKVMPPLAEQLTTRIRRSGDPGPSKSVAFRERVRRAGASRQEEREPPAPRRPWSAPLPAAPPKRSHKSAVAGDIPTGNPRTLRHSAAYSGTHANMRSKQLISPQSGETA
jgi:hypothetical protein